jgi:hypothetical protein
MPPSSEIDIAQILLGVHNSPALKAQPAPKRPRFDSEFSLGTHVALQHWGEDCAQTRNVQSCLRRADTLSDLCARENAMIRSVSTCQRSATCCARLGYQSIVLSHSRVSIRCVILLYMQDTSPAGTFVEDVDEEDSDEEDGEDDVDMVCGICSIGSMLVSKQSPMRVQPSRGGTAFSAWVHPKDATLSAEAAAFLQKRRSEWAERVSLRTTHCSTECFPCLRDPALAAYGNKPSARRHRSCAARRPDFHLQSR